MIGLEPIQNPIEATDIQKIPQNFHQANYAPIRMIAFYQQTPNAPIFSGVKLSTFMTIVKFATLVNTARLSSTPD